ncbi:zf-HC2 domain-containing protein [Desulfotruncus alcoholivorax]|uniref:zf-HC2 domain-containing protein n=1 Tax=Desulfotruncus alcoholivorax TaxID=265477 RepID=UPI000414AA53|nr:zf-HC2 domain-containing protein [Desulfotruncus alcoholivorax]
MINRECEIIKDLLPLYADGVASAATLEMVEQHLAQCTGCSELLEMYRQPALPVLASDKTSRLSDIGGFWNRLRWVAVVLMAGIIITGSTIAWASYQAGRNLALRDPSFHQAGQMDLFTEVNQSQKLGPYSITVNKILLDSARTTIFYSVQPGLDGDNNINIKMIDDKGVQYDLRGDRGLHGKYFICDLDPVNLDTEKIILSFSTGQAPGDARFEIPVDPTIVAQNTRELYPDLKTKVGPVELDVDRAVLGLSESIIFFRARWPQDQSIAGVGIGLDRPMFTVMGPNGPSSAESRVSRTPTAPMIKEYGAFLPGNWADLIDVTNGKRIKLNETHTQTDPVTGGIKGSFYFEPVEPSARELKLTSPPLYLYRFPEKEQTLEIDCPRQGEQALSGVFNSGTVTFALERAAAEDNQLALYFKFNGGENKPPFYYRPDFKIKDKEFWQEHISLEWLDEQHIKVTFPKPETDHVILQLKSVGEKLPKVDFKLDAAR